jgi:hypothetical protein
MGQINRISRKGDERHPFILVDHIFNCVHNKNHFYDKNIGIERKIDCLPIDENLNEQ